MATFKFDMELAANLQKAVPGHMRAVPKDATAEAQRKVNEVARTHKGKPEGIVLAALARAVRSVGAVSKPQ
ncbi:hypothetical protein ACI78R_07210 [Geodermatophilus sp. SYSU D01106]